MPYHISSGVKMFDYIGLRNFTQGLIRKSLKCNFYKGQVLVFSSSSNQILFTDASFAETGPLQIKCPVSQDMISSRGETIWDSVSIERDINLFRKPVI